MFKEKRRQKNWIKWLGFLLVFWIFQSCAAFANTDLHEVELLQVEAVVDESHRIEVLETVDVAVRGEEDALFRTIPLVHKGRRYELMEISGEGVEVAPYWKKDEAVLEIRKSSGAFRGNERFRIAYVLQAGADAQTDRDSFYLSVISPDWNTYIHKVKLRVELPASIPAEMVELSGTLSGHKARETMAYQVSQNQISAESQFFLVPKETVSLQVQLPEGAFSQAVSIQTFYERTETWAWGLMAGAIFAAFGLWLWSREKMRKPELRIKPPHQASPAGIGYLFTRTVKTRDLSILLIEWANRGWIHIYPNFSSMGGDEGAVITLERRPPSEIPPFELRFFNLLFDEYGNGHRVRVDDLRGDFSRHLMELKAHLAADYGKGKAAVFKNRETKTTIELILLAGMPVFFFWIRVGMENHWGWVAGGLSLAFAMVQLTALRWLETGKRSAKRIAGAILISAMAGFAFHYDRGFGFITVSAAVLLIMHLVMHLEKRTAYGLDRISQYLGYRAFLSGAKHEQLLTLIQESPELYFQGLPYAERLGVLKEWKNAFKEIFNLAPIWYHNKESMDFSIEEFTQEIMAFVERFESAMEAEDRIRGDGSEGNGKFNCH